MKSEALNGNMNKHPFDLNAIASPLEVDDGYNQDDVLRDLFQGGIVNRGNEIFSSPYQYNRFNYRD